MEIVEELSKKWDKMQDYIVSAFEDDKIHILYVERLVNDLTDAARKEALIGDDADEDYVKCVFLTVVQNICLLYTSRCV